MSSATKKWMSILAGVFLVSVLGCYLGCLIAFSVKSSERHSQMERQDPHEWLHGQLGITPQQNRKLDEVEGRFEPKEIELKAHLSEARKELGAALREEKTNTPKVAEAVEAVHRAMADLQQATIEHLFEMEVALTPEQYQRLLNLASDSLIESP